MTRQCSTFRNKCWGQLATKFSFLVPRTSILVAQNYIQEPTEYNKLNMFYLALTEEKCFRLPQIFLSNGFRSRLENQLVFGKMNPHSSISLSKQVFEQWNTHLNKQTLGVTKKLIWVIKQQNLQNLFSVPCTCMFRNEHW